MTPHQQIWWPLHHYGLHQIIHTPFDSQPEFATLLGKIIERWVSLEKELAQCLAVLLDGNIQAAKAIIYSLNSTCTRIAIVRSVAREIIPNGPEKAGFLWLIDRTNNLQKQRNDLIHGEYWHTKRDEFEILLMRPANAEPVIFRPIKVDGLKRHLAACEELELQLALARHENPEWNVPNMTLIRQQALSRRTWPRELTRANNP